MFFFEKDLPGEIVIQPRKTNFKKSNREFDQLLGIKLYDSSVLLIQFGMQI